MFKRSRRGFLAAVAVGLTLAASGRQCAVYAQTETVMHVHAIRIDRQERFGGGPRRLIVAVVAIRDQFGNPVAGATVTGDFSGCFTKNDASAETNSVGDATVLGKGFICSGPCTLTFRVTGVTKTGATYDPSTNVVSEASDSCG